MTNDNERTATMAHERPRDTREVFSEALTAALDSDDQALAAAARAAHRRLIPQPVPSSVHRWAHGGDRECADRLAAAVIAKLDPKHLEVFWTRIQRFKHDLAHDLEKFEGMHDVERCYDVEALFAAISRELVRRGEHVE
jgi:hypothetical protein